MAGGLRAPGLVEARRSGLIRPRLPRAPAFSARLEATCFPTDFFQQPVVSVARELLGACLVSDVDGFRCAVLIVETEAYGGREDPASHAATRSGITRRNRAMFGEGGRAYVYRSYGVHWCLNVVTGSSGAGQAVLLRGGAALLGSEVMADRRGGRTPLAAGPGRLAEALGVTDALYGHDLAEPPLRILPGWCVDDEAVAVSGRIGIRAAADWPYRFYVRGLEGVSPVPHTPHAESGRS